MISEQGMQVF